MKIFCHLIKGRLALALFICLVAIIWTVTATAGGNPLAKTCEEVGKIEVRCTDCATGAYIGSVIVPALHDASVDRCHNWGAALKLCSDAYGHEYSCIGMTSDYLINGQRYHDNCPKDCKY